MLVSRLAVYEGTVSRRLCIVFFCLFIFLMSNVSEYNVHFQYRKKITIIVLKRNSQSVFPVVLMNLITRNTSQVEALSHKQVHHTTVLKLVTNTPLHKILQKFLRANP